MAKKDKKKDNNQDKIYRLPIKRFALIFSGLFVAFEIIFYLTFQGVNGVFFPFDLSFYIYTPILLGTSIMFCVMSVTQVYYKLDSHKLTHVKRGKVYQYFYCDILYVDEQWSLKHKMLLFYDKNGKAHYLSFDKEGAIYNKVLDKAPLMTREEFQIRFPNVKL